MIRKLSFISILVLTTAMFSLTGCVLPKNLDSNEDSTIASYNKDIFPESSGEFEIQGLLWRTIAYYYHPGIYREIYSSQSNRRLIEKAKKAGANYLLVRAFYSGTEDGELIGNDDEAEYRLQEAITYAHEYGMSIFLTPFIESMEFWPVKKWNLSTEEWTTCVLKWARFAEENHVEMFAPGFEMAIIMEAEVAREWYPQILRQIGKLYSGEVAFVEIPYGEQWDFLDGSDVFSGYDCAGITVFPWMDYDGIHDLRSFDDLSTHVEGQMDKLMYIGNKYDIDCCFVATLGMDHWHGKEPAPDIRAQGYDACLDIFEAYHVDGVFLHIWASEPDHLGENKEVENMLSKRWVINDSDE